MTTYFTGIKKRGIILFILVLILFIICVSWLLKEKPCNEEIKKNTSEIVGIVDLELAPYKDSGKDMGGKK